jgi:hypothetical protein
MRLFFEFILNVSTLKDNYQYTFLGTLFVNFFSFFFIPVFIGDQFQILDKFSFKCDCKYYMYANRHWLH